MSLSSLWPVLGGLLAGIAVFLLTDGLSKSEIGGPGWSLKGNGALVVVFAVAPALLAAGWVALAERAALAAVAAGLATLVLDLVVEFAPIVLSPNDAVRLGLGLGLGLGFAVLPLGLAALAGVLIARGRACARAQAAAAAVIAIALSLVVPGLEFVLVPLLVPVVLATPIVARRRSVRLAIESVLYLAGMVAGSIGCQYVLRSG